MIRFIRDLRLVPIVLVASACLLVLRSVDLLLDSGYIFPADDASKADIDVPLVRTAPDRPQPPASKQSWAQEMFNYPDVTGSVPAPSAARRRGDKLNPEITGAPAASPTEPGGPASVEAKVDPKPAAAKDGKDAKPPGGTVIPVDPAHPVSGAERAILERLQQRRQELDARARELDIRESLIKAAEKRLEKRLNELKETEGRITTAMEKKEEAEAARLKGLVTMYENMKPRDAAKVFDRLDIRILLEVATQINPRRMSDILAQMSPDAAERLTVEIANRSKEADQSRPPELPKIEGQPTEP